MGAGTRGIAVLEWMIVCTVICALMILLRYWSARLQKRKAYADDWMVLIAFVGPPNAFVYYVKNIPVRLMFPIESLRYAAIEINASVVALEGVGIWAIFNGLGKHTLELETYELGVMQKLVLAANVCWLVGTVFNKLSVLWLYRRVFNTPTFLKWTMGVFLVVIAFGISFFVVFMTQCHPVSFIWNPVPGGACRDLTYQEYASVSVNMAIDLAIFILPLPVLWTLQMTTRNKVYVTIMLSFGLMSVRTQAHVMKPKMCSLFLKLEVANIPYERISTDITCSSTIAVMAWRIQATYESTKNPDFVYTLATIGLISGLELWLGIIVACMPTIPPVIQAYVRPLFERLTSYYQSYRGWSVPKNDSGGPSGMPQNVSGHGLDTLRGPDVPKQGLSTEVSSPLHKDRTMIPMAAPNAFTRAFRSKHGSPHVTIADDGRVLLPTMSNDGRYTQQQEDFSSGNFQGIVVHHAFDREENQAGNYRTPY